MTIQPLTELATHTVSNQVGEWDSKDLFSCDLALHGAVHREMGSGLDGELSALGQFLGDAEIQELGREANRNTPELVSFDRFGQRIGDADELWQDSGLCGIWAQLSAGEA